MKHNTENMDTPPAEEKERNSNTKAEAQNVNTMVVNENNKTNLIPGKRGKGPKAYDMLLLHQDG